MHSWLVEWRAWHAPTGTLTFDLDAKISPKGPVIQIKSMNIIVDIEIIS